MTEKTQLANHDHLLAVRRSLLGSPVSLQVHSWLRPIYYRPPSGFSLAVAKATFSGMVSVLNAGMKDNPTVRTALDSVSKFVSVPFGGPYQKVFDDIRRSESSPFATFVSVVYARAVLNVLASTLDAAGMVADLTNILSNPVSFIDKYLKLQGQLDENFVGHLVAAAEVEAQVDPHFEKVMNRSSNLFQEAHKPKNSPRDPFGDQRSRLDLLRGEDQTAWWIVPANMAFAMTVWQ
jgi:hypothetical protein